MVYAEVCVERRCCEAYRSGSGEVDTVWRDKYLVSGPAACLTKEEAAKKTKSN